MHKLMLAAIVVALAAPAFGQRQQGPEQNRGPFGRYGSSLRLLEQKPAQEELKLTADQIKELQGVAANHLEAVRSQGKIKVFD